MFSKTETSGADSLPRPGSLCSDTVCLLHGHHLNGVESPMLGSAGGILERCRCRLSGEHGPARSPAKTDRGGGGGGGVKVNAAKTDTHQVAPKESLKRIPGRGEASSFLLTWCCRWRSVPGAGPSRGCTPSLPTETLGVTVRQPPLLRSLRFTERGSSPLDRTGAGTPLPSLPPPAARQTTRPPCAEAQPAHINYRSPDQASSIRTAARPSNLGGLLFIYLGLWSSRKTQKGPVPICFSLAFSFII